MYKCLISKFTWKLYNWIESNSARTVRSKVGRRFDFLSRLSSVLFVLLLEQYTIQLQNFQQKDTVPISLCGQYTNAFVNRRKYSDEQHGTSRPVGC
jgi:hypothetical protein